MRKSFTRFLSVFMLFCAFGLQAAVADSHWLGASSIPKDEATNIKPGDIATQFVLAFDAAPAITATGGTLVVYKGADIIKLVPVVQNSADVKVEGKNLVVKHGIASFIEGSAYSITLSLGAVKVGADDVSIAPNEYTFAIGDYTPPVLASTNGLDPADGATNVKANLPSSGVPPAHFILKMKFNENVKLGTGEIAVYNVNGTVMDIIRVTPATPAAVVTIAGDLATITLSDVAYFAPETNYFVKVDQGTFTDIAGNKYAGINDTGSWNWSTRDESAPVITASATEVTATSAKLNVLLNEAGKVKYTVNGGPVVDGGDVAANTNKVYPLTGLTGNTDYEVEVWADNTQTPPNTSDPVLVEFTTGDNEKPEPLSRGSITENKKTVGVFYVFDEKVQGGTGTLAVRKKLDNALVYSVPASAVTCSEILDGDGHGTGEWKAVMMFNGSLPSTEDYFIVFPEGYIKDMSNNPFDLSVINDINLRVPVNYYEWEFESSDFEAPIPSFATSTVAPGAGNITGAALTDDVKIVFNENVALADGKPWPNLQDYAEWTKYLSFQKDGINIPAEFTYAANTITINPVDDFTSNTVYTLIMRAGIVKDVSPNANVLAEGKTITVTTGDLDILKATFGPAGISAGDTPLTIVFNKEVRKIKTGTPAYEPLTNVNVESTIKLEKNDGGVTTVDPLDYNTTYDAASKTITVVPSSGKAWASSVSGSPAITYTLSILADAIEDNGDTDVEEAAGAVTNAVYPVIDFKKPVATLVGNELLFDPVLPGNVLTITFDEAVTAIPATTPLTQYILKSNDAQGANLPFTVTNVGNIYTLTPNSPLELGKTYYYGVGASMADGAGNVNLAAYKSVKIVGPVAPPVVTAQTYTVNGSTPGTPIAETKKGVEPNSGGKIVVVVEYDVAIRPVTPIVLAATSTLGTVDPITTSSVSGKFITVTITPTYPINAQPLAGTVTIPLGLVEANAAGTGGYAPMSATVVVNLETKDKLNPNISSVVPAGAGVAVDAAVKLTFSESVTPVAGKSITFKTGSNVEETVSITSASVVKDDADGKVWEVKHAPFVKYGTDYTIVVPKDAFVDAAGNVLNIDYTFTDQFEVIPNPAPAISSLVPADEAEMVSLNPEVLLVFNEPVVQASITGSRKLVYVIEKKGAADATIDGDGDLVIAGDDVQKYFAYVDDLTKVVVDGKTVGIKGVTLEANKDYYILVTPGAFKDVSLGTPAGAVFAGITAYGTDVDDPWNFTTSNVVAAQPALSFNKPGNDGFPARNSDIILTFTKKIVNLNGSAITNSQLSALPSPLIKLEKWNATTSAWDNIKFTGTITNESVITIDNSSLVILDEMKTDTKYRVSYGSVFKNKDGGTPLDTYGGDVNAPEGEFWTTDATAPTAPAIAYLVDEVNSVYYDATKGHTIKVNISSTDVNSGLPDHTAIKTYYLKSTYAGPLSANDVKGLAEGNDDDNFDKTWEGGMESKTKYYIYAVAEDVAGNLSGVTQKEVITDDVVKPALAGPLPTSFDAAGNISLVFNEPVKPAAAPVVPVARVIDNATGIVYTMPLANLTTGTDEAAKTITIVGGPFAQMATDVHQYTIEIDPGMIVDVPRQVATVDVNAVNAWDGIVGTSFQVVSKDQVKPVLGGITPSGDVDLNQAFTISFSEPVNLNNTFVNIVVYDGTTPYDVVNTTEISGQGTNAIVVSPKRALVSGKTYTWTIADLVFTDLAGNVMVSALPATRTVTYTAKDVVILPVAFRCPQDGDRFYLPVSQPLAEVPSNLDMAFGVWNGQSGEDGDISDEEMFYINPNDPIINTYELASHLWMKVDGVDIPFTFDYPGQDRIRITAVGGFSQYKDKSITYGFVNLYDASGNLNPGAQVSVRIAADAIPPADVVTFIPGDNDWDSDTKVNIPVNQEFKVEFYDEEKEDNHIYSYHATNEGLNNLIVTATWLNDNDVFTMDDFDIIVTKVEYVNNKTVVTIVSDGALDSEEMYDLELNANKIQIGQGHDPLGYYSETFMTADVTAPKLIADGSGNTLPAAYKPVKSGVIGKDQMLALEFDEPVVGKGQVLIHRWDGVLMATVDITGVASTTASPFVINIGKPADIMASNPLFVTNVDYYIEVPDGTIVDKAATPNAFAGIVAVNEWKISLRDDTTPQVVFVDNTKDGLPVNTAIKLTFDRPVDMGKGWLALYYEDGKAVDLVRTSDAGSAMESYDFTLTQVLAPNTKYWVELGEGTFELNADNSIKQEQQAIGGWYFTTEVNSVPVAETYSPDKGAEGVALNSPLVITFDQKVIAGTGNIQLHRKQNVGGPIITNFNVADPTKVTFVDNTLTIAADVLNLQNNSEYYVIVPATAVKNTSSTPEFWGGVVVPFEWAFTTLNDAVAPTAVYSPLTTGLTPAEVVLTMTFSEPVMAGTGNLMIHNAADDAVVETVAIAQSMFAGQVVTVTPTTLVEDMSYYVMVDAGAVKDIAGNSFAGVTNKTDWTFGTGDFTAPVATEWTPKGEIADNHPTFKVTYDSPVVFGNAGNLKVYKVGSTTVAMSIPVTAGMVSGNMLTVTYEANATTGLDKFTDYYVLVDAGVVKDMAGNAAAAITDPTAWTFKTGDFKTAVDPNVSLEFKVYPNPFVDYVNVANADLLSKIVVTNIAGQTVKQVVNPTERIQLNELRSGVYFMSMYDMDNVVKGTAKIVKR